MDPSVENPAAASTAARPEQLAAVDAAIAELKHLPGALLPILHAIQARLSFVPPAAVAPLAAALNLSQAEVLGVISFYHDFRTAPPGAHVLKVCRAEACQAVGSEALQAHLRQAHGLSMHATSRDGQVTVEPVYCLGNCALGPSVQFDGRLHARVSPGKLDQLLGRTGGCGCGEPGGCQ